MNPTDKPKPDTETKRREHLFLQWRGFEYGKIDFMPRNRNHLVASLALRLKAQHFLCNKSVAFFLLQKKRQQKKRNAAQKKIFSEISTKHQINDLNLLKYDYGFRRNEVLWRKDVVR